MSDESSSVQELPVVTCDASKCEEPTAASEEPTATSKEQSATSLSEPSSKSTDTNAGAPVSPPSTSLGTRCLCVLAVHTTIAALYFGRPILLPITMALLLALTLRPVVRRMRTWHLPDAASAAILLTLLLLLFVGGLSKLVAPAETWISSAPKTAADVKEKLKPIMDQFAGFAKTSKKVEELTETTTGGPEPVVVEMRESWLTTNLAVASITGNLVGTAMLVIALAFFLLTSGDRLLNNILTTLPNYSSKKRLVQVIYEVEGGITSYLFTVTIINLGVGVLTTIITASVGIPNPVLWGVIAFALQYIPAFGPVVMLVVIAAVSIATCDSLAYALIAPGLFCLMAATEGNLVTPALVGKSLSLSPIVIFLALIFWGWIWGLGGALLAVPLLAGAKIALDKFDRTRGLSVILGE